ncbi:cation diffusion facilitator family transporter [Jiulongibacter sediminis]|uniref:Cobalt transporter n=1 Tax=Jiulongibacter sediminis TaxID=1605367 RepID=A0A0P7BEQ9_9BACT|nr:cation diffusion facilitator family transporter [Jiulongibacter sediminis]KPM49271.1 cobalt transporter [Jiulongibacter sediminis]TBX26326.1 cobalt transporter [Jiulongibacter sediminis]
MAHDHSHTHGHSHHHHHHGTGNISTAFWLNISFTIIEVIGGFFTNSVAILSDALHDLGDSLSLGLAWYFQKKSGKRSDSVYTYGYGRFSLVGALINSIILIVGSVYMLTEAIPRILNPEESDAQGMFWLAILGIVVNGAAVFKLKKGDSLNERAVMLHLMEDVLGWAAVLIGSIIMYFTGWTIIDPLLSIGITVFILFNVYGNLKGVFRVILQGTPEGVNMEEVKEKVTGLEGIKEIHDVHLWTVDGQKNIMSLHAVLEEGFETVKIKDEIRHELQHLEIEHVTIETENADEDCGMEECC